MRTSPSTLCASGRKEEGSVRGIETAIALEACDDTRIVGKRRGPFAELKPDDISLLIGSGIRRKEEGSVRGIETYNSAFFRRKSMNVVGKRRGPFAELKLPLLGLG